MASSECTQCLQQRLNLRSAVKTKIYCRPWSRSKVALASVELTGANHLCRIRTCRFAKTLLSLKDVKPRLPSAVNKPCKHRALETYLCATLFVTPNSKSSYRLLRRRAASWAAVGSSLKHWSAISYSMYGLTSRKSHFQASSWTWSELQLNMRICNHVKVHFDQHLNVHMPPHQLLQ